jgi:hypothetical protein
MNRPFENTQMTKKQYPINMVHPGRTTDKCNLQQKENSYRRPAVFLAALSYISVQLIQQVRLQHGQPFSLAPRSLHKRSSIFGKAPQNPRQEIGGSYLFARGTQVKTEFNDL